MAINKIVFWKIWLKKALKNRDDPRSFKEMESVIKNIFLWDVELEVRGAKSQRCQWRESTDLMGSVRAAVSIVLHIGNVLGVALCAVISLTLALVSLYISNYHIMY